MLFNKNDKIANEKTIYQTKPSMLFGCKKAFYGVILLIVVLSIAPSVISFVGEMQVYLISYIKLALTRYVAIAFFVIILFIVLYIIWQLVNWYYMEYTLTDSRIIIKTGVLYTKKNYMPYSTIQDVSSSQSIIAKIFNVGTVSVYSAYDNNQMSLINISNVDEVENIIFSKISSYSNNYHDEMFSNRKSNNYLNKQQEDYFVDDEYYEYDDKSYGKTVNPSRDYDYYPEDLTYQNEERPTYEYEYFDEENYLKNNNKNKSYYNEVRDKYSTSDEDYFEENEPELYYNDPDFQDEKLEQKDTDDSSVNNNKETIIKRHFDKFKK